MLTMRDVSVSLGGKSIVSNVFLSVEASEFVAIIGPNGSGKSTIVKAISGELKPSAGDVSINGIPVHGASPSRLAAHRAVLSQASNLSFPFTVSEVVRLSLLGGASGIDRNNTNNLVSHALECVDLADFEGRFYQELSGGEKQRVQLARVLCQVWVPVYNGVPRFLILDEPTSSLDIRHQLAILDLSRSYARAGGGVVAVLHDLNVTAMYADRIIVVFQGRIEAVGAPSEVLTNKLVERVFGLSAKVNAVPKNGMTFLLPQTVTTGIVPDVFPGINSRTAYSGNSK
jgi:heme transport system ATP-binding protein